MSKSKKLLQKVVESLINDKAGEATKLLSQYLSSKTRRIVEGPMDGMEDEEQECCCPEMCPMHPEGDMDHGMDQTHHGMEDEEFSDEEHEFDMPSAGGMEGEDDGMGGDVDVEVHIIDIPADDVENLDLDHIEDLIRDAEGGSGGSEGSSEYGDDESRGEQSMGDHEPVDNEEEEMTMRRRRPAMENASTAKGVISSVKTRRRKVKASTPSTNKK